MAIDLYQSRNDKFNECKYFKADPKVDIETLVHSRQPAGIFYASEVSPDRGNSFNINDSWRFERSQIMLETNDEISDLKTDDIVIYKNEKWIVADTQFSVHREESEFCVNHTHGTTLINLRK